MLYNDSYSLKHHQNNLNQFQQLVQAGRVNLDLQLMFEEQEHQESLDFWREVKENFPLNGFSIKPYITSTYRHLIHYDPPQTKLKSFQRAALKRFGNTILDKQADVDAVLADCRALGFNVILKPLHTFFPEEDTHYVLEVKERLT